MFPSGQASPPVRKLINPFGIDPFVHQASTLCMGPSSVTGDGKFDWHIFPQSYVVRFFKEGQLLYYAYPATS